MKIGFNLSVTSILCMAVSKGILIEVDFSFENLPFVCLLKMFQKCLQSSGSYSHFSFLSCDLPSHLPIKFGSQTRLEMVKF